MLAHPAFTNNEIGARSLTCVRDDTRSAWIAAVISSTARNLSRFPLHPSRLHRPQWTAIKPFRSFLPVFNSGLSRRWFNPLTCKKSETVMPAKAGIQAHCRFELINRLDSGFHRNDGVRVNSSSTRVEPFSFEPRIVHFINGIPRLRRCR